MQNILEAIHFTDLLLTLLTRNYPFSDLLLTLLT